MATTSDLISDLSTALEGLSASPTRMASDYRLDLDTVAAGSAKYALRVSAQTRIFEDSNATKTVALASFIVAHRLATPTNERAYTEGAMQTDLTSVSALSFYRNLASVSDVVSGPDIEIDRVGHVIAYEVTVSVSLVP